MTATTLATAIAGTVVDHYGDARITTPAGLVYTSFNGAVKLQRHGKPVVTLGTWQNEAEVVAAYEREVG